jgi:hypothetical protein
MEQRTVASTSTSVLFVIDMLNHQVLLR